MVKPFDATFVTSTVLVVVALGLAWAAVTRTDVPVLGTGIGILLAVGVVGIAACAVGGIGTVSEFDFTEPRLLVGTVLGVLALAIIVAGLAGWTGPLQPLVGLVPGEAATVTSVQLASLALAIVIAVKWVIDLGIDLATQLR